MKKTIRTEYFSLNNITAYFPEYNAVVVWQRENEDLDTVLIYLNRVDAIKLRINLEEPENGSAFLGVYVNSVSDVYSTRYTSLSDVTPNIMHEPLAEARYQYDRIVKGSPEKRKSLFGTIDRLRIDKKIKR